MNRYPAVLLAFLLVVFFSNAAAQAATGPLKVSTANPRYFTDGSGEIIYLTGSHAHRNFRDGGTTDPPPAFDYAAYLDFMQSYGHNFMRMWAWELFKWNDEGTVLYVVPQPWQRTGPGTATDGKAKFDLTKFNQAYFDRLRSRIIAARDRGIYVSIMLFEGWGLQYAAIPTGSTGHPFYKDNNINGVNCDSNNDGKCLEAHRLENSTITSIQEAYVRKVIDTVNDLDNVLYEIANEDGGGSVEWQYHMINYIKNYEANKSKQHPVGMTFRYQGGNNNELFSSPADWISPGRSDGSFDYLTNPRPAAGTRVIISDTDHIGGYIGDLPWVWKSFTRGLNPIFMEFGPPYGPETPLPDHEKIRKAMGHTLTYARKMNLANMAPRGDLTSTGYALANPGSEYLIYTPSGGSFTANLNAGTYNYEWFNPSTGSIASTGTITANSGSRSFTPPFSGVAVLYLKSATALPPPACDQIGSDSFFGCYYDNIDLTNLRITRSDAAINFSWGAGSPDPQIAADTFSARWEGDFDFAQTGTYMFAIRTDDGIRVWIDGALVLDKWVDQPPTNYNVDRTITQGIHRIKVEYYENGGGAVAQVSWQLATLTPSPSPSPSPAGTRDPALWPFDKLSPWNRPLGAHAVYEPIRSALTGRGFSAGSLNYKAWTVAYWIASPSDPVRTIYYNRWMGTSSSGSIQRRVPDAAVPSPDASDRDMLVISPNHMTVLELYRVTRLSNGNFEAATAYEVNLTGMGERGIVTNGMSLAGGNIRAGEFRNGIHHALAFTTSGRMWNRNGPGGRPYVWPARRADSGAMERYGASGNLYMGSWVAIPSDININTLGLETPEGRVLARALQDYGAIGSTSGGGDHDRIIFRFDYAAYAAGDLNSLLANWSAFKRDLDRLARQLQIVVNSHDDGQAPQLGPTEGIGGGTPLAPLAPPFAGTRDPWLWPLDRDDPYNRPLGSGAVYDDITEPDWTPSLWTGNTFGMRLTFAASGDPARKIFYCANGVWTQWTTIQVPDGASPSTGGFHWTGSPCNPDNVGGDAVLNTIAANKETFSTTVKTIRYSTFLEKGGPTIPDVNANDFVIVTYPARDFPPSRIIHKDMSLKGIAWQSIAGPGKYIGAARTWKIGGVLRKGELSTPYGMRHANQLYVSGKVLNMKTVPGGEDWVWPAAGKDAGANYPGTGNLYMGSLLALPPSLDLTSFAAAQTAISGLETNAGLELARGVQDYGLYIIDTSPTGRFYLPGDESIDDDVGSWGSAEYAAFKRDIVRILKLVKVVSNNHDNGGAPPNNIPGGSTGTLRRPLAPPFAGETPATFDFSLSSSGNIAVTQGNSGTNTITATKIGTAASQPVTFSCQTLPTGSSCSFSPDNTCSPTCTTTLTITAASTTPTGTYTITVTGTGSGLTRTTAFTLTVNPTADSYTYTTLRAPVPPTIDGDLAEYANAPAITLTSSGGNTGAYKLLWDDTGLYIAASVSDTQLNSAITTRDGGLWNDDSIELFFDVLHNHGLAQDTNDYKFFVNLLNTQSDSRALSSSYNTSFASAVKLFGTNNNNADTDTGYAIEIRIPWSAMERAAPPSGTTFGFDFSMNDKDATTQANTIWANTNGNTDTPYNDVVNDPDGWGHLVFSSATINQQDTTPPAVMITHPFANRIVFGAVRISAAASDNIGIRNLEIYIDSLLRSNLTAKPYIYSWNATQEANGAHVIMARAYDVLGNSNAHSIAVTVDDRRRIVDMNEDGKIDMQDVALMILSWKKPGKGDVNNDGVTDLRDVGILLSRWTG